MNSAGVLRRRVFLYIVRKDRLLVVRHVDFPELGLQIPGGTVEAGEAPLAAAAREAREETGLERLGQPRLLGASVVPSGRKDERFVDAWYFRIHVSGSVPERWRHVERFAAGVGGGVRFELTWLPMTEVADVLNGADRSMLDAV